MAATVVVVVVTVVVKEVSAVLDTHATPTNRKNPNSVLIRPAMIRGEWQENRVSMPDDNEVAEFLSQFDDVAIDLAWDVRMSIFKAMPRCEKRIYRGWNGLGYHDPDAGYVCAIFPTKDAVRVAFEHGYLLPDPRGLLTGDGKRVRYFEISKWNERIAEHLSDLIEQALAVD